MSLLKSDLFRFFAIGFVAGGIGLFATIGLGPEQVTAGDMMPAAVAAPVQ